MVWNLLSFILYTLMFTPTVGHIRCNHRCYHTNILPTAVGTLFENLDTRGNCVKDYVKIIDGAVSSDVSQSRFSSIISTAMSVVRSLQDKTVVRHMQIVA